MKVSCILAIHKNNLFWPQALESVLKQTYDNFELLIIFNGGDETFFSELKAINHPKVKLLRTNIPQLSYNLNYGIQHSDGELIARMDADDISEPTRFAKQVETFKKEDVDVLGSNYQVIDSNNNNLNLSNLPINNEDIRNGLRYKNVICHPSVMFKKATILKHNAYLGGKFSEDYNLWIRLSRDQKVKFKNLTEPLLKYRIHQEGQAKGNKIGYAEGAGYQLTEFLLTFNIHYLLGMILSVLKTIIKGK
jgi:cellulose synthase/poly-beta-1,6-N-acetylglucosamine synthase-like glycosyltransferase